MKGFSLPFCRSAVRLFLLSIIVALPAELLFGQIDSQANLKSARENQDYSFAAGLYRDKLYQLSSEQFDLFLLEGLLHG